jgi:hypothetical protein
MTNLQTLLNLFSFKLNYLSSNIIITNIIKIKLNITTIIILIMMKNDQLDEEFLDISSSKKIKIRQRRWRPSYEQKTILVDFFKSVKGKYVFNYFCNVNYAVIQ